MDSVDARILKRLPAVKETPSFQLDVHLRAQDGVCVLIGASGAGKTLLLNCLGGFVRPDSGRILVRDRLFFDAEAGTHLRPELRHCGYIFQDHALFPHMTVRDNLRFAASFLPRGSSLNLRRRINDVLDTFDLSELGDRKPAQLSGGQKQRAALARLLITDPAILLLDEPSRGLDAHLRQSFYTLLHSVRKRVQAPILLVTHYVEECFELANSVAILEQGRLIQQGAVESVLARPATVSAARLLGVHNIVPAEIRFLDPATNLSQVRVFGQELEAAYFPGHLLGDKGFLCMRRSEWRVVGENNRNSPNQLSLAVERSFLSATGVRFMLEHGLYIDMSQSEASAYSESSRLTFSVPRSALSFVGT